MQWRRLGRKAQNSSGEPFRGVCSTPKLLGRYWGVLLLVAFALEDVARLSVERNAHWFLGSSSAKESKIGVPVVPDAGVPVSIGECSFSSSLRLVCVPRLRYCLSVAPLNFNVPTVDVVHGAVTDGSLRCEATCPRVVGEGR